LSAIISIAILAVFLLPAIQQAFTQAVQPDGIVFVNGPAVLETGGKSYVIDIQLTIQGANYSGNYFGIYFQTSDPLLVDIPQGSSVVSDSKGRASYNITTGQGYGNVTITASLLSPGGSVRSSKTYLVTASGNVSGTVVEASGKRISGATVTLYSLENGEKGSAVPIAGNPATSVEQGTYAIESVPYGSYVIEAAIDGQNGTANLTVSSPDQSMAIAIPGYVAPVPTSTPTPEPTAAPTEQPSPTVTPVPASPTPVPKTPTGDTTKQLVWIVAIALVLTAIIVGVQLLRQRKSKK
jgi:hypothetical protein